jgi:heat shock protein HslJ
VRRSRIEGGRVILDVVQQGPDDAACCPSQKATRTWTLGPDGLEEQPVEFKGTLSLEDLGETEWILRSWTWTEEAPAEPEVTLTYLDGRLVGSGGCNRYFADVKPGALPGELEIGSIGATKMACPPPAMEVEDRFFSALAGARSFRFLAGRLALTFAGEDGGINTMLFEERTPAPADEP